MQYAAQFRSDGEAMCLAIAQIAGLVDRHRRPQGHPRRPAGGLALASCPN